MTTQFYIPSALVRCARAVAIKAHTESNHRYGELPYAAHLADVASLAIAFVSLIPDPEKQHVAVASAWLHDVIEDARLSYNDIAKVAGHSVAEAVYLVTNNKGRNREERANAPYYLGIARSDVALFVKLCDRLANALNAGAQYRGGIAASESSMMVKYRSEHRGFKLALYDGRFQPLWDELDLRLGT